ncbi:restriction endonuclease subunit S [Latilactobacillus curvatus]|nr:restriction endonuclease subunit S [Latilactobacillus curvatus]
MKEQKKQPELRFKGFTDDWEQVKLSELVTKEKSYSLSRDVETEKETETRYIHYGDIHTGIADKITNKNQLPFIKEDSYEPLLKGDLILADASEDYQGIATPAIILETTKYRIVAGLHTIVLRPSDKCDSLYLYYLLKTKSFKRHGYRMGTGMKVFGITANNVLAFKTLLPSKKEQNKISQLLKIMDRLLTLQQRKLDLLTKLKQGYLQQLFPSKDKYLPRLRFKEFNGDWKQCTMGEIFTERTERSGEGELISVTINSGVVKASELDRKDNSSKNKSNYKKVEIGDIAYNSMRMWQGASGYSPYKGILSPAYTVITPKNEIDSEFFAYDFKRFNMIQAFKRNSQGLTSDTWNLKFPTLKSIKINVPHFDEQRRISNTFNQVDNMLLLQQTKIDQLNKLKQAYLQKLFP